MSAWGRSAVLTAGMMLLVGCGGGSDGDTGTGTQGSVKPKLIFDAMSVNPKCSQRSKPVAGVTVLTHSADGKVIASFTTDAQGRIEADWPMNARHATAIHKNASGKYTVNAMIDVATPDLGRLYFPAEHSDSECKCTDLSLNWSDIKTSMPEYSLAMSSELQNALNFDTRGKTLYQVCQNNDGQYGKLQVMLMPSNFGPSYAMETEISNLVANPNINLNFNQFKNAGRVIQVFSNVSSFNTRTFTPSTSGRAYHVNINRFEQVPPRVFEQDGVKSAVGISYSFDSGSYYSIHSRRVAVAKTDSSVQIDLPKNDETVFQSIQTSLTNAGNVGNISYDFSYLKDYSAASYYYYSDKVEIDYNGPMKATIPNLEWPNELRAVINSDGTDFDFEVNFWGYNPTWDYKTFRQKLAERSRDLTIESKNTDFLDYRYFALRFN